MRTVRYTRRYFLISRILRYASYLIAAVETSAVLILVFSGLLMVLPFAAVGFTVTAVLSKVSSRKYNKIITDDLRYTHKTVVIDAKRGYFRRKEAYLNRMAHCFRDEGYTVIVVSHAHFTDRFLTAARADERIWVVKLNYFFSLKRTVDSGNVTYVY